jgi:hypothetical protein
MNDSEVSVPSVAEMQRLISAELSLRARLGYSILLLVAAFTSVALASLWLTEPSLPLRTHVAFAAMVVIGLSWVGYAVWVLTRRRVLLAGHRIIAARMAVTFSAIFSFGFAALGFWGPNARAGYAAAITGLLMLSVAVMMLRSARRRYDELMQRRRALEEQLAG